MEHLIEKVRGFLDEDLIGITISNPRKKTDVKKHRIRPVRIKDRLLFQWETTRGDQVFHENLSGGEVPAKLAEILPEYKQVNLDSLRGEMTALINKKKKAAIKIKPRKKTGKPPAADRLSHNRKKRYLIEEGTAVPFLLDLGVMTPEGKIVKHRYDKYRQINRFLEFIEDVLPALPKDRPVRIVDFGCGRSYLTFAMYYYLHELKGYEIEIIGLDLKKEVIRHCRELAKKYGYDQLHFVEGAIEDFDGTDRADMVVSLHACDTATDYALYKALSWDAEVILSVPCCQHEMNAQLKPSSFKPITDYGILKERFAAMATDAVRANLLKSRGYHTQILEFIDMEHTPKNLLIRAVKNRNEKAGSRDNNLRETRELMDSFGVSLTLYRLLEGVVDEDERQRRS